MFKQTNYVATFLICFLVVNQSFANRVNAVVVSYIEEYKELAITEMNRSGIPASITLAQGILESSAGQGELALNSNNHFGIKCKDDWNGPVYFKTDDDYEDGVLVESCFRSYPNAKYSFEDHSNFLLNRGYYTELFSLSRTDYIAWAKGLKKCGYATDPAYAEKLIGTIETYELYRFDTDDSVIPADLQLAQYQAENAETEVQSETSIPPTTTMLPENYQRNDGRQQLQSNTEKQGVYHTASQNTPAVISPLVTAPSSRVDNELPIGDNTIYILSAPGYNIDRFASYESAVMLEKGSNLNLSLTRQGINTRIMSRIPKSQISIRR